MSGSLSVAGETDVYQFAGVAGEQIMFDGLEAGNSGSYAALVSPTGKRIFQNLDLAADTVPLTLFESGTYSLLINGSRFSQPGDFTGDYRFRVLEITPNLTLPNDIAGTFNELNGSQVFQFEGVSGQKLFLEREQEGIFGTAAQLSNATAFLSTSQGGTEDGYLGIDTALQLPFRDGAAANIILVTDEDRDIVNPDLTFESIFNQLDAQNALLNVTINGSFLDGTGSPALGVDSDGAAYIADGTGGFTTSPGGAFGQLGNNPDATDPINSIQADYVDLAWDSAGAGWDLNQLREGGDTAVSFTKAFVNVKAEEISEQLAIDLLGTDPNVTVENLTGPLFGVNPGETATFDAKITGDGLASSFELFFVRPDTGFVLGSIPVAINQNYLYLAQAVDPDGDPLTYNLLNAPTGATIDSTTGRIDWIPPTTGIYQFEVAVADNRGAQTTQVFEVEVVAAGGDNTAPTITSTAPETTRVGSSLVYQVTATDAENDPLTFFLTEAPEGVTIAADTGLLSWTPTDDQIGEQAITVKVVDGSGGSDTQSFAIAVNENQKPIITSTPLLGGNPNQLYEYDVDASDPEGTDITYSLRNGAPDGMTIDPDTGLIRWTPTADQEGYVPVTVFAEDADGIRSLQSFLLTIGSPGGTGGGSTDSEIPVVSLGFDTSVVEIGENLNIQVQAFDDKGITSLELLVDDSAVALTPGDLSNGMINQATVQFSEAGLFEIVATAGDADGNLGTGSITIRVLDPSDTNAPTITIDDSAFKDRYVLTSDGFAPAEDYQLNLAGSLEVVQPQAGNVATFTGNAAISSDALGTIQGGGILETEILAGSTIEQAYLHLGTLTTDFAFRPDTIMFEGQSVELSWLDNVQDMSSFSKTLNFEIAKADVTDLVADKVGNSGGIFEFNISEDLGISSDLIVGSSLTVIYSNPDLPESTIVLLEGGAIGAAPRTTNLTFANPLDLTDSQVTPQLSLGILFSDLGDPTLAQYTSVDINGDRLTSSAGDYDDGTRDNFALITVGGVGDNLDNPEDPFAIRDFSDDELYNLTPFLSNGDTELTIETRNPSNDDLLYLMALTLPASVSDIQIINPEPAGFTSNRLLTANTDIVASISDRNLTSYRVEYAPIGLKNDPAAYTILAEGTSNVEGVLASLDPKTIENGEYQLRVVASDVNGNLSIETTNFSIGGENKPGRFELEFVDLSVPLTGIPIEIYRRYDSLESKISGDFGHGWTLGIQDARIEETSARGFDLGGVATFFDLNPMAVGDRVTLTTPDGERVGFTFEPQFVSVGAGRFLGESFYVWRPYFRPDPGVYHTLEVDYMPLNIGPDGSAGLNLFGLSYNPNTYRLITKEGITYEYDQYQGLQTVTDRNDNTLSYTDDGIFSSTGQSITFNRDAQGRIIEIIDPEGNSLEYSYDASGNLVAFGDRTNNETTFKYEGDRPHYLTEIIDPLGRVGVRTEYDENGQISAIFDADGNALDINYDSAASRQTVKDPFGNTTTFIFDERGNVIQEIDALGGVTARTYDANYNVTSETDPEGNTTSTTYDSRGNKLTETDGEGNTTTYTYNANNDVLTETNANGNVNTNTYDGNGNLTSREDANGNVTTYEYGQYGLLTNITDAEGNESTFAYDSRGYLTQLNDPSGAEYTFTYDNNGNVTSLVNDLGQTFTFTYDSEGRQISQQDAEGNACGCSSKGVTQTEYNAAGDKVAEIDANGNRTEYIYDDRGLLIATIYPDSTPDNPDDNPRILNEYDALDQLIATTDELGRVTYYEYDALQRLVKTIYPDSTPLDLTDNPFIQTEYYADGLVAAEIDELGNRTEFEYDGAGNLILQRDGLGNETTLEYDAVNNQVAMVDANGNRTEYRYDGLNQLIETEYADGTVEQQVYSTLGYLIEIIDQAGVSIEYEYDALGRLTKVIDALGGETEYIRDTAGNILQQIDANDNTVTFTYDDLNRVATNTLPLGQVESTTYDAVGNVKTITDYNGVVTTYEYDERNRLISRTYSDGTPTESFTYTLTGQLATVTDNRGTTVYEYDERDRLISRTEPNGRKIEYTYDAAGNILSLITESGVTVYTYDALNRIDTVTDADNTVTDYDYDAVGNLVTTTFGNGVVENRDYDSLNRLIYLENVNDDGVISSFEYTLDAVGNRIRIEEEDGRITDYEYDLLYRLTEESVTDPMNGDYTIEYVYDAVGNRLQKVDSVDGTTTYIYDENDRLLSETTDGVTTQYQYDDAGNLTATIVDGETTQTLEWNAKGELTAVEVTEGGETGRIEYEYDHNGVRVSINIDGEETRFLLDTNQQEYAQVIEEYTPDGDVLNAYTYGWDLISQNDGTDRVYYQVDGLGSTRNITDINGAAVLEYTFDAYGNLINQVGDSENNYLFTGEQFDNEIGLQYNRARYYDANTGRFISRDPFEGFNDKPISLPDYLYGNANPLMFIDPSGEVGVLTEYITPFTTIVAPTIATIAIISIWYSVSTIQLDFILTFSTANDNSRDQDTRKDVEYKKIKDRCDKKPPFHWLRPNEKTSKIIARQINETKWCIDQFEAWDKKWLKGTRYEGKHDTKIKNWKNRIRNLSDQFKIL